MTVHVQGRYTFQQLTHQTILQGFDEYMNLVLDNAEEVNAKKKTRKHIGRVLLKGENITLMQVVGGGNSE